MESELGLCPNDTPLSCWRFTNGVATGVTLKLGSVFTVAESRRGLPAVFVAGEIISVGVPNIAMGGDPSGDTDLAGRRFTLPPLK